MLQIGSLVDNKYKVLSEIGHGGMSVVYLSINERANKTWAIKELRKDGVVNYEAVKQGLVVETNLLKRLNHPHLPSIIDVIDTDDSFLIVMDYVEGKSLQSVLQNGGAQPQNQVIEWGKQLCDVLGYLHSQNPPIIHRDMKPANVILKPDGNVMLLDFGAAREFKNRAMVEDTTCLGTRGYAAPEQFGGHGQTDARTDIYCLGATLYHLLTGHSPADPPYEIKPLSFWDPSYAGTGIEKLIAKCCQQDPAARYQNCEELMYALEHIQDEDDIMIRSRRRKWAAFLAGVCVFAAGILGTIGFGIAKSNVQHQTYDYYVSAAQTAPSLEGVRQNCMMAIELTPSRQEAYNVLMDYVTSDSQFTAEEENAVITCINGGQNRHHIDYLQSADPAGYDNLQYQIGYAYFFFCGHQQGKISQSAKYFETAMNSTVLSSSQVYLSQCLYRIAKGYENLVGDNKYSLDENEYTYRSFWDDLNEIASGNNIEALSRPIYTIALYNEVAYQINDKISNFRLNASVTEAEMDSLLQNVRGGLEALRTTMNESQLTNYQVELSELEESISAAEKAITTQYYQRG